MNDYGIQEEITVYFKIDGKDLPFKYPVGTRAERLISDRDITGDLKKRAAGGYVTVNSNDKLEDRTYYAAFKASNSAC